MNTDIVDRHYRAYRCRMILHKWHKQAELQTWEKKMEAMTLENKIAFDRMMKDAEDAEQEVIRIEKERARLEEERQKAEELAKKQALKESAAARVRAIKESELREIEDTQRFQRRKRIKYQIKDMRSALEERWVETRNGLVQRAKQITQGYIDNKENKLALKLRFNKFKAEFFKAPSPSAASQARERMLASQANYIMLFLEHRMNELNLTPEQAILKFDKDEKGGWNYQDFSRVIEVRI